MPSPSLIAAAFVAGTWLLLGAAGVPAQPPSASAARVTPLEPRVRVTFRGGRKRDVHAVVPVAGGGLQLKLVEGGVLHLTRADVLSWEPHPAYRGKLEDVDGLPRACWADGERVRRWDDIIEEEAARLGLQANLVRAMIAVESCGDPAAVSSAGAGGLMQLMPATAALHGCDDRFDPRANIRAGCRHVVLLQRQHRTLDHVLAAYNGGGRAIRANGTVRFAESRRYVQLVKAQFQRLHLWGGRAIE